MDIAGFAAVGLYAGLNTLILLWIALATGRLRQRTGIYIGDGGNMHLVRILRGHANALETIPVVLILMLLMAAFAAPAWVIHLFGIALTVGRFFHAMHFIAADAPGWQRRIGAGLSLLVALLAALGVIGHAIWLMAAPTAGG
ncbi:MAG: MAPEG family protein [Alphaproteobacteria bacterium]